APKLVLSIYVDTEAAADAAMVAFAVRFMLVAAAFQLFDGLQAVAAGALRGLRDTRIPMIYALFGYWVPGFGTAVFLGVCTPLRGVGIWIGRAVGLIVVALLMVQRWMRSEALSLVPGGGAKNLPERELTASASRPIWPPLALSSRECQSYHQPRKR